jgi:hypothetical protein
MHRSAILLVLSSVGIGLYVTPAAAQNTQIGIASAVVPRVIGTPPGAAAQVKQVGQAIVFNERVATSETGQAQLLFLDQSSMTVGPNSDITLDEYVYDPKTSTGKMAISVTKGVFRFIGGKISKQDDAVTIKTPTGTAKIKGGIATFRVGADCEATEANPSPSTDCRETIAIFQFGDELEFTTQSGMTERLRRTGFAIVTNTQSPFPLVRRATEAELNALKNGLESTAATGSGQFDSGSIGIVQTALVTRPDVGAAEEVARTFVAAQLATDVTTKVDSLRDITRLTSLTAGVVPSFVTIPIAGTGTYGGAFAGTVVNGGATFTATGTFLNVYNFGLRSGTFTVSNFDSRNYAGGVGAPAANPGAFSGALTSTGGGAVVSGSVNGTFITGGGDTVRGVNGAFNLQGTDYRASGSFSGQRQ